MPLYLKKQKVKINVYKKKPYIIFFLPILVSSLLSKKKKKANINKKQKLCPKIFIKNQKKQARLNNIDMFSLCLSDTLPGSMWFESNNLKVQAAEKETISSYKIHVFCG